MGCKNSKDVQVLDVVKVSIEVIQNSILNTCEQEYDFCDKCILYKTKNITHCNRCNECHDNRKTLFCEFCVTCINFSSEIDIMSHRRRHDICKLLRGRNQSI
jgi:hypothetical protein